MGASRGSFDGGGGLGYGAELEKRVLFRWKRIYISIV